MWHQGSLFWISQCAILFAIVSLTIVKHGPSRLFAWIVLGIVISGWVSVVNRSESKETTETLPSPAYTASQEWATQIRVARGTPFRMNRADLRGLERVNVLVRYNGHGEMKLQTPDDYDKTDGLNRLPDYVETIEIMPIDSDLLVKVARR